MRRLLVLSYFYPPLAGGGVHRALAFTRHLPDHGWDCTVVCADREDYWVVDESLVLAVRPDTEVVRVPGGQGLLAWLKWRGSARGRRPGRMFAGLRALSDWWLLPDSYIGWAGRARRVAERLLAARGRFAAMLSTSPPDSVHVAALGLRHRHRLPWVADFRDPWIGLTFRTPPTAWHRARQQALERRVLESADLVLAASRTHAAALERGDGSGTGTDAGTHARAAIGAAAAPRRVLHLPNGYEPDRDAGPEATRMESNGAAGSRPDGAEHFLLVFTGTLSQMPDAEVFLEALHDLLARRPEARRRVRARLAGAFDTDYADRAVALGLRGIVEFTGPLAHAESRALQRRANLLLLWKPRGLPTMVPGKLYEYLDAGRPLIALLERNEEAAELVRRAGGTLVPPGDRAALEQAIDHHYESWKAGMPAGVGRPEWLEEHARPRLAARLARALDELVSGHAP